MATVAELMQCCYCVNHQMALPSTSPDYNSNPNPSDPTSHVEK